MSWLQVKQLVQYAVVWWLDKWRRSSMVVLRRCCANRFEYFRLADTSASSRIGIAKHLQCLDSLMIELRAASAVEIVIVCR